MRHRIRTATLTGYADLCRSLGLDAAELVAAVGLRVADLDPSDRWIAAAPAARLLELSAQRSGVADFALRLSELRGLGTLGPLSVVLRDEPDLRGALALLVRYEAAYNEALHLRMSQDDVLVTVSVWLEYGEPAPTGQALDLAMAALVGIIRQLVGADWEPLSSSFGHPAPADPAPYRRMFGPWVRFGQDSTGLVFHARDLDLPVVISDASLRPYTRTFLGTVVTTRAGTTTEQVAEVVEQLLPLGLASAEQVGRRLGMRPRQLQRALAADDETFSRIVHGVRARLAERYLAADGATLTELSRRLGFAAPSAFSRWFRQQFGISPTAWRDSTRSPPVSRPPVAPIRRPTARPSSGGGTPSRPSSAVADD